MASITFLSGTQAQYDSLSTPRSATTLYYITDTNRVYKGDSLFTDQVVTVTTKPTENLVKSVIYLVTEGKDKGAYYSTGTALVAFTAEATDYTIYIDEAETPEENAKATYVVSQGEKDTETGKAKEIKKINIPTLTLDGKATASGDADYDTILKKYTLSYGGDEIKDKDGKAISIDIPRDLVVTSGEVIEIEENDEASPVTFNVKDSSDTYTATDAADKESTFYGYPTAKGTYIKLSIANQSWPIFINVADLATIYTGTPEDKKNKGGIDVSISADNEISAALTWGTIA